MTGAVIVVGISWLARQACGGMARAPKKFLRAIPVKRYPGSLKPLEDIRGPGIESG